MKENKLIFILSLLIVGSHFLIIMIIVFFRVIDWYGDEEVKTSLPIISPIFASFTTLVIRFIINNRENLSNQSKSLNLLFVIFSFLLPIVFVLFILFVLLNQATRPLSNENFAVFLGVAESVFGVYTGYIVRSLFENKKAEDFANNSTTSNI